MEIKQGFYVKQYDDNYYLVLEVKNKNIKAVKHRGTPMDAVILECESLTADGYTIEILSEKDVYCITKFATYLKNGIPSSYPIAVQYKWSDKEYTIPLNQKYWNGSKWAEIPEGFYNET